MLIFTVSCSSAKIVQPSDDEIELAYQSAAYIMSLFDLNSSPWLSSDESKEADGRIYDKVDYPGIETMAGLKAYLETLFADSIVERLLDRDQYRDIDGSLYGLDGARGSNIFAGDETHEIIRESDEKIIYRVVVEVLDIIGDEWTTTGEYEIHDMVYEYIDGKWIFTQFELVR